jgi:hypothetical protein
VADYRDWIAFASLVVSFASFAIAARTLRGPDIKLRPPHVGDVVQTGVWSGEGFPRPWHMQCRLLLVNQGRRAGVLEEFLPQPITVDWKGPRPQNLTVSVSEPYLLRDDGGSPLGTPLVVKDGEIIVVRLDLTLGLMRTGPYNPSHQFAADLRRLRGVRVGFTYTVSTKNGYAVWGEHIDIYFGELKRAAVDAWRANPTLHTRTLEIYEGKEH